ncbi:gluconokinase [Aureimonas sp. SA4125]|uniref:gluconokinase n=1 Tax=Aureimonas sp. SA4125 TaxID=2826993 RepID=UPI001CC77C87|nr:gluconokinase [Aureimonas sp. SA4125]BDA82624.1 gluconokinase [Aureimonas sp. SA4125]
MASGTDRADRAGDAEGETGQAGRAANAAGARPPPPLVLMGVSGSGKTTLGEALRDHLGFRFFDADGFHPQENVAKMAAGIALDDADRAPWLARLADLLAEETAKGEAVALACSALRRRYRDRLRQGAPDLVTVLLEIDRATIEGRLAGRKGHYMPPSLLDSQLATLEQPDADERVIRVDAHLPVEEMVAVIVGALGLEART